MESTATTWALDRTDQSPAGPAPEQRRPDRNHGPLARQPGHRRGQQQIPGVTPATDQRGALRPAGLMPDDRRYWRLRGQLVLPRQHGRRLDRRRHVAHGDRLGESQHQCQRRNLADPAPNTIVRHQHQQRFHLAADDRTLGFWDPGSVQHHDRRVIQGPGANLVTISGNDAVGVPGRQRRDGDPLGLTITRGCRDERRSGSTTPGRSRSPTVPSRTATPATPAAASTTMAHSRSRTARSRTTTAITAAVLKTRAVDAHELHHRGER